MDTKIETIVDEMALKYEQLMQALSSTPLLVYVIVTPTH